MNVDLAGQLIGGNVLGVTGELLFVISFLRSLTEQGSERL